MTIERFNPKPCRYCGKPQAEHIVPLAPTFACVVRDIVLFCYEPREDPDLGRTHLFNGEFQSDKYPTTPRGKVPLSTKDPMAQDLLWEYAQRRRLIDAEFADDLEAALRAKGYDGAMQRPSSFGKTRDKP